MGDLAPAGVPITVPPLTNRTIVIIKNTALGSVIGVPEILNVSSTAGSSVGNITPLTLGAIAFLVLFHPDHIARPLDRDAVCLDAGMNEIAAQFFNLEVMTRVFPIVLRGLGMTLLLCAAVIPLGLIGGLIVACLMQAQKQAGAHTDRAVGRSAARLAAAVPAHSDICGPTFCGRTAVVVLDGMPNPS